MNTGDESPVSFRAINDNRISNREKLKRQWREKEDEVVRSGFRSGCQAPRRVYGDYDVLYGEAGQLSHRWAEICWYLIYFEACICL